MSVYTSVTELVGKTPLVEFKNIEKYMLTNAIVPIIQA